MEPLQIATEAVQRPVPWLSAILWLPLLGGLLVLALPERQHAVARALGLVWSLLVFVVSLGAFVVFDDTIGGFQLVEDRPWVASLGIRYAIGLDGISLCLVLLTTALTPLVLLASAGAVRTRVRTFVIGCLVLETAAIGALVAVDLVLFYVFWELMVIPIHLLIGIWGGAGRLAAASKFAVMAAAGSAPMLVALLALSDAAGGTFLLTDLYGLRLTLEAQTWMFAAFGVGFAVRLPMVPLHTWSPRAHAAAPDAGSLVLTGLLLPVGAYGFVRFTIPLFPDAAALAAPYVAGLGAGGVVYGALLALAQTDLKRLVAYASLSHLGVVALGLISRTAQGVEGAMLQLLNHAIAMGALCLLVGALDARNGRRRVLELGGLGREMPVLAGCLMVAFGAAAGVPATAGFVGEVLVLVGAFTADGHADLRPFAVVAAGGLVLGAVGMAWRVRRLVAGPPSHPPGARLADLGLRERAVVLPLLVLVLGLGLYPNVVLDRTHASVARFVERATTSALPTEDMPTDDLGGQARVRALGGGRGAQSAATAEAAVPGAAPAGGVLTP
jgi:NADH-quinone oxidoreductase subunit M